MTQQASSQIFDTDAWRHYRGRAASGGFAKAAFVKEMACVRLAERLDIVMRDFTDILDIGCHGGQMGTALPPALRADGIVFSQCDSTPVFVQQASRKNRFAARSFVMTDELLQAEPESLDLVVSALYLHWMNDLPGMLVQIRRSLRPDGLFLANLLGGRSLSELRNCLAEAESEICGGISPRCMPMADIRDLGGLLQRAGFALPVADAELVTITYPDMFRLMADLRNMGAQNCLVGRVRRFTLKAVFLRAAELYKQKYSDSSGQLKVSVELISLTGWAPDKSQPVPLRPGSAAHRLAQALETTEVDIEGEDEQPGRKRS